MTIKTLEPEPPNLLTGALLLQLFNEAEVPLSDMPSEADVSSWWKHYAGRVRNALHRDMNEAPESTLDGHSVLEANYKNWQC